MTTFHRFAARERGGRRARPGLWVAAVAAAFLGGGSASAGLVIDATFDSTITSDPNAAAIEGAIDAAVSRYESLFTDNVTVSIDFRYATTTPNGNPLSSGTLARSNYTVYTINYGTYISHLTADKTTANDDTAVAHLPASGDFPNAPTRIDPSSAGGRAVGLNTPGAMDGSGQVGSGGTFDGIVTLNSNQPFQFDRTGGIASDKYDAQQSIQHEIDEILGLGSVLPNTTDFSGNPAVRPEDLFRYSAPGALSLTSSGTATSYLSIDGGSTSIAPFNQNSNGDYGDWGSTGTPLVQLAFSSKGTQSDVTATSPEGIALDVIGYDLITTPEPGSVALALAIVSGGGVVAGLRRARGK